MASLRDQLLAAFAVEYRDHVEAIRAILARASAGEAADLRDAFRRAHSLKGAARAVDMPAVEAAAHAMESGFAGLMEEGHVTSAEAGRIASDLDAIQRMVEAHYQEGARPAEAPGDPPAATTTEFVRINAQQLQVLSVSMHELTAGLDMMDPGAERLANLAARAEGLARLLERASTHGDAGGRDVDGLAQEARMVARGLATATRQQRDAVRHSLAAAGRVRSDIELLALVPAGNVFAGLEEMVRNIAAELGRLVKVTVDGLDVQADRGLLQALRDPVIHLLRNAVAHGIEPPAERRAAGKPETGEIALTIRSRAGRLELAVTDDGRGPDLRRIEEAAVRQGLLGARNTGQAAPSADRLLALVFEPGFSTAETVDKVSGRGMGLSVVAEAARRAGGGAMMSRRLPWGAEILVSTPLSASRQPVLVAEVGEQVYGLPSRAIERVVHARSSALQVVDGRQVLMLDSEGNKVGVPVVSLRRMIGGTGGAGEESETVSIAVLRQGEQRLGVRVDALSDVRTLTVSQLAHDDVDELVQGAVQLDQRQVGVVINPEALMRRYFRDEASLGAPVEAVRAGSQARRRTVLVVDDSVTTRTLEKSILEANGYSVLLAVDGVDALDRLRASAVEIDLVVADVEMPRMDGFQLLAAMKNDRKLSSLPIIMMTSRASPDDVRRGMDLGADAYLVKQTFDQRELLDAIGQLL